MRSNIDPGIHEDQQLLDHDEIFLLRKNGQYYQKDTKKGCLKACFQRDDHMRCADFQRSKLKCCTPKAMNIFRIFFLVPMMGMWTKIFIDNPMGPTYFETQWGYLFTCMSLFSSVMTMYSPWW